MLIRLPQNKEFEEIVLGAMLNSGNAREDALHQLDSDDFYTTHHAHLFQQIKGLSKISASVDVYSLSLYAKNNNKLADCGSEAAMVNLCHAYSIGTDYQYYLNELKNLSSLRKLIGANKLSIEDCVKPDVKADDAIQDLYKKLFDIQGISKIKTYTTKDLMDAYSENGSFRQHMDWMRERSIQGLPPYLGIQSHFDQLDQTLGFFKPSCIYYIGARTSMGKTTFMLNLMRSIMKNPSVRMGVFSLEMPAATITAKLLCMLGNVQYSAFEDGRFSDEIYERLIEAQKWLTNAPIFIEDQEGLTISVLRARARRMVSTLGAQIIFIDYLTRIRPDQKQSSKHNEVDEISKGLQSMAKELKVPVICLAQLNRNLTARSDTRPNLADFRESGSIEEDCDGALLLHRPDYYNPNDKPGILQVIVAKNRIRGQLRTINFTKSSTSERFDEAIPIEQEINNIKFEQFKPKE